MKLTKHFLPPAEPDFGSFPAPVFVVGCMRSGTTFLVDKLTQHPQLLKVGLELRSVWTTLGQAPCEGPGCAYRSKADVTPEAVANMTYHFSRYLQDSRTVSRYLVRVRNLWQEGGGRIHYDWPHVRPVNKSTHLMNKVGYVAHMFPSAHFVLIIRDIKGQVASMKKFIEQRQQTAGLHFMAPEDPTACWSISDDQRIINSWPLDRCYPENFSLLPEMWLRLNGLALEALETLAPERVTIIGYEQLVNDQAETLRRVFDRLALREAHKGTEARIIEQALKVYNTSTKGDPLDKWKRDLTEQERALVDEVVESHSEKYAYIRSHL